MLRNEYSALCDTVLDFVNQRNFAAAEQKVDEYVRDEGASPQSLTIADFLTAYRISRQESFIQGVPLYLQVSERLQRLNARHQLFLLHNDLADHYLKTKDYGLAFKHLLIIHSSFEGDLERMEISRLYYRLAQSCRALDALENAAENAYKAWQILAEDRNENRVPPELLADNLILLGTINHELKQTGRAREVLAKALPHLAEPGTKQIKLLLILAHLAFEQSDWSAARQYAEQAGVAMELVDDLELRIKTLLTLGSVAYKTGHWDDAMDHNRQALELARQNCLYDLQAKTLLQTGLYLAEQKQPERALSYYDQTGSLPISQAELVSSLHKAKAVSLAVLGHHKQAYESLLLHHELEMELASANHQKETANLFTLGSIKLNSLNTQLHLYKNVELQEKNVVLQKQEQMLKNIAAERDECKRELLATREEIRNSIGREMLGRSRVFKAMTALVEMAANSSRRGILITGESGTGKELAARALYNMSRRCGSEFFPIKAANIVGSLFKHDMFMENREQHTHNAAITVFIDDISNLTLPHQQQLLTLLTKDRDLSERPIRIISATEADLSGLAKSGVFEPDLYRLLAEFVIAVPPLRERPDDIPLLWDHFVRIFSAQMNKTFTITSPAVMEILLTYSFPGNIRELRNLAERAVMYCSSDTLELPQVLPWLSV